VETSDDEPSSTIDSLPGIGVNRYRLTNFSCTPPLYITYTPITIFSFAFISHYQIIEKVGEGGMSQTFPRAERVEESLRIPLELSGSGRSDL
jgi:hypothetical protein